MQPEVVGFVASIDTLANVGIGEPEEQFALILKIMKLKWCKTTQSFAAIGRIGGNDSETGLSEKRVKALGALSPSLGTARDNAQEKNSGEQSNSFQFV